jgi:hypothetical protein
MIKLSLHRYQPQPHFCLLKLSIGETDAIAEADVYVDVGLQVL